MGILPKYGQLDSERKAEEFLECRNIVKELINYGLSQRQFYMLIYLLSQEIEDVEVSQVLVSCIRDMSEKFLIIDDDDSSTPEKLIVSDNSDEKKVGV